MNHKYINSKTFEFVDNVFEVDEEIADSIVLLNKKGYKTMYCCSGHVKDFRLYEKYEINKSELDDYLDNSYVIEDKIDKVDILTPYENTHLYIKFDKDYNFDNLPSGFVKYEDNTIDKEISYYKNNTKKNANDIYKEILDSNKELYKWVESLPNIKD